MSAKHIQGSGTLSRVLPGCIRWPLPKKDVTDRLTRLPIDLLNKSINIQAWFPFCM